jgi:hypothetical protein
MFIGKVACISSWNQVNQIMHMFFTKDHAYVYLQWIILSSQNLKGKSCTYMKNGILVCLKEH